MKEELMSVGIDIGTTTTQLIFSRIFMESTGRYGFIPVTRITDKVVVHRSGIFFTPLVSPTRIDVPSLMEIISSEYDRSGIRRKDINTGAVIITGETARKENAAEVLHSLAGYAGDFVVSTAGPDLESILAGWGAGAGEMSRKETGSIINFDVGGGTTNAAVFFNGEVMDSFALDIGGRLVRFDEKGNVTYISEKIIHIIKKLGLDIKTGQKARFSDINALAGRLADMFLELISAKDLKEDTKKLFIGHENKKLRCDNIMFSGGVAEYIYGNEVVDTIEKATRFKDFGPLLGYCIRKAVNSKVLLKEPGEKIRATVIGAGNYSMSVSGNTVAFDEELLPLKNIPVLKLFGNREEEETAKISDILAEKLKLYSGDAAAIAFRGPKCPGYRDIKDIALQIVEGTRDYDEPLVIIVENDFAKALGQTIRGITGGKKPLICLDRIRAGETNCIDIGKPVAGVIPVVLKTLIFN